MSYRPRRASAHWLEGAPEYVLSCHDNGGASADRYTVYFGGSQALPPMPNYPGYEGTGPWNTAVSYLAMSETPSSPQGVGISGECKAYQRAAFMRTRDGRKCRWLDLPDAVQRCVERYATDD